MLQPQFTLQSFFILFGLLILLQNINSEIYVSLEYVCLNAQRK